MPAPEATYQGDELELFRACDRWKGYVAAVLAPHLRGDVLEVGAGIGGTTAALYRQEGVRSWTAVEPDPAQAAALDADLARLPDRERVRVVTGRITDLPRAPDFDAVVYVDVLEHIADDRAELVEAAARLRPGGALVVLGPAHGWLFSAFDAAIGHHRRYTRASLTALTPAGLRLRAVRYLDAAGLLASLANRVLLRQAVPTAGQLALWDRCLVPVSRRLDRLLGHRVGKSVVAVWEA